MSVALTVILPAQPATGGGALFTPFGGDGRVAPIGVWEVNMTLVGDAGGGNAELTCGFDRRYTSIVTYAQASVTADTAAGEFLLQLRDDATQLPNIRVVGTLPGVAETFSAVNSSYLWYPPPIWLTGDGRISARYVNVDATETYNLDCQIYVFDRSVRQITAMQTLLLTRIGVNAPTAT